MNHPSGQRPTWAEIDLDALAFNFRSVKEFVGNEIEYMAVVKADAYGHGAVLCEKRLEAEGADWLAVATLEEGTELRQAGILIPILILGGFYSGQENAILNFDLTPVVFRVDQADTLNAAAKHRDKPAAVHLKIDTGMGRVGFRLDEMRSVAESISKLPNIEIAGLMTHFAVADKLAESDFTNLQISRFEKAVEIFHSYGFRPKYLDLANSPAAVAHPLARSKMVRLGGVLYGLGGDVLPGEIEKPELRPVMSVRTQIALVKSVRTGESVGYGRTFVAERDSVIATIPIGYHDGLSRSLSNKGRVIIRGQFAPIIGRVSMDWTTVDVTDIPGVEIGDTVTVIGSDGGNSILAEDIAALTETISYEVTCGVSRRVPRIYPT